MPEKTEYQNLFVLFSDPSQGNPTGKSLSSVLLLSQSEGRSAFASRGRLLISYHFDYIGQTFIEDIAVYSKRNESRRLNNGKEKHFQFPNIVWIARNSNGINKTAFGTEVKHAATGFWQVEGRRNIINNIAIPA